jgi:hypothetical protein
MMKIRLLCFILLLAQTHSEAGSLIDHVKPLSASVPQYGKFEIAVLAVKLVHSQWLNPYNPADVNMYAEFTSPSGRRYRRNAFWYQDFERCNTCVNNVTPAGSCSWFNIQEVQPPDPNAYMTPRATPYPWRVRFAPPDTGIWSYKVFLNVQSQDSPQDSSEAMTVVVTASPHNGYLKVDTNHRYFRYRNNGEVFIPIGLNALRVASQDTPYNRIPMSVVTELTSQITDYDGNFLRIMMGPDNFGFEWKESGLGNYDARQHLAFDLDSVLTLAEKEGLYLQMVVSPSGDLRDRWSNNPYNRANPGGVVSDPDSFFIHPVCVSNFKQRMRYIIARWGYSPNMFGYELMQEIELYTDYSIGGDYYANFANVYDWCRSIIQYCRTMDTLHMYSVTTGNTGAGLHSYGGRPPLYAMPEQDFINAHAYSGDYNMAYQRSYEDQMVRILFPTKPFMVGEIGLNWGACYLGGLNFLGREIYNDNEWHNALWSSAFGGSAGPGLYWGSFYDMVHPRELNPECHGGQYKYLKPFGSFVKDEPIFVQHPKPIANPCTGRGPKDYRWYDTSRRSLTDRQVDPCACFQPQHIFDTTYNLSYVADGITTTRDSLIEVLGLKTSSRAIGWVHHKMNYWYELPHKAGTDTSAESRRQLAFITDNSPHPDSIPVLNKDSMKIADLAIGRYQLSFYSTWPDYETDGTRDGGEYGGVIPDFTDTIMTSCSRTARFKIPSLRPLTSSTKIEAPDYGFKISWIGLDPQRVLTANATWDSYSIMPRSVIVPEGVTLTISNSTIAMQPDSFIAVLPGGRLTLDNAILTSVCPDDYWYGIQAINNTELSPTAAKQPVVEIKNNSLIMNSKYRLVTRDSRMLWDKN